MGSSIQTAPCASPLVAMISLKSGFWQIAMTDSEVPMLSNNTPAARPPAANAPLRWSWMPTLTTAVVGRFVALALVAVTRPSGLPLLQTGGRREGGTPAASKISLDQSPRLKSYARVRQARLGSVAATPHRRNAM